MDLNATRNVIRAVGVAFPAYREWLAKSAEAAAVESGAPRGDEAVAMLRSMQRVLTDVSWEEVEPILAELERGDLAMPPYGDVPRFLRSQALERRALAAKAERERAFCYAEAPRYRCLHCRDTGVAHALDPQFVSAVRIRFEAMADDEFAATDGGSWWLRAKHWFRAEHGPRKVEYSAACCCIRGDRLADRMQRLDERRMPVLHGLLWVRETLAAWYESHDPCEVEFWEVPQFAEE